MGRDRDAREVDALVFAEHAAVDDLAVDVGAFRIDAQLDEAVGEEDAGAGLEIFSEGLKVVPTMAAVPWISRGVMVRRLPATSWTGMLSFELAGTDLGALKIGEDAEGLRSSFAIVRTMRMSSAFCSQRAVGEIEAGDVEARADELAKDFGR